MAVGKGFINAYVLEQEAIYPRVTIDPAIIKLIDQDKAGLLKASTKARSIEIVWCIPKASALYLARIAHL